MVQIGANNSPIFLEMEWIINTMSVLQVIFFISNHVLNEVESFHTCLFFFRICCVHFILCMFVIYILTSCHSIHIAYILLFIVVFPRCALCSLLHAGQHKRLIFSGYTMWVCSAVVMKRCLL